jgi:hypothetical protein
LLSTSSGKKILLHQMQVFGIIDAPPSITHMPSDLVQLFTSPAIPSSSHADCASTTQNAPFIIQIHIPCQKIQCSKPKSELSLLVQPFLIPKCFSHGIWCPSWAVIGTLCLGHDFDYLSSQ